MSEIEDILKTIEDLRSKLNDLYAKTGKIDKEVVALSQMLDRVLDEYQRLIRSK